MDLEEGQEIMMSYLLGIKNILKFHPPDNPHMYRIPGPHLNGYSDALPFKILWVDPADIVYCSNREFCRWGTVGKVKGGNWDQDCAEFEEASFYNGIHGSFYEALENHFLEDIAWEDTEFFKDVLRQIEEGRSMYGGFTDADQLSEWLNRLERLYESIESNGYLSQKEIIESSIEDTMIKTKNEWLVSKLKKKTMLGRDEIAVDIGRDGDLLFYDNKHRLAIAKILQIEKVPVRIVVRHADWQKKRDHLTENNKAITNVENPDLMEFN
ncbi:hypothetical protein ACLI4Q_18825 [Natrialbaceae archaeon A-CW1-1]